MVGGVSCGMVGLHMKGALPGGLSAIFRNWLTLRWESLQSQQAPKCQSIKSAASKGMMNIVCLRNMKGGRRTRVELARKRDGEKGWYFTTSLRDFSDSGSFQFLQSFTPLGTNMDLGGRNMDLCTQTCPSN